MTTVSIHQPGYLPWLGYLERIARSDAHVFFDDVQFDKNSFDNRNKIRTAEGSTWLSVPVLTKGKFGENQLREAGIDNHSGWPKKHWKSICFSYQKAPFFKDYAGFFENVYTKTWDKLLDLNLEIITGVFGFLGIKTQVIFSSSLEKTAKKSDLVLEICKKLNAGTYLSGALGRNYLELPKFEEAGIKVIFQDYQHPVYTQRYAGFQPFMSVIDLLFNEGPKSYDILMNQSTAEGGIL